MRNAQQLSRTLAVLIALAGTLACSLTAPAPNDDAPDAVAMGDEPVVALAAPLDGAVYLEGVAINVVARVTNAGDNIDRVEVLADDNIVTTVPAPNPAGAPAFSVTQSWTPDTPGTYQVSLAVFRADGSSASSEIRTVEVIAADDDGSDETEPTPQPTATPNEQPQVEPTQLEVPTNPPPEEEEAIAPEQDEQPQDTAPPPEEEADTPEQDDPPEDTANDGPTTPTARLTAGANIRGGPGTTFPVIGTYAAGTETEALAVNGAGTWYKIQFYNSEGWVFGNLVDISGGDQLPIDNGPPPPAPTDIPPPTQPPADEPDNTNGGSGNANLTFNGSITIDPFPPNCGDTMSFRIPVQNNGTADFGTTAAIVIRDVHIDSGAVTETRAAVPDLAAGGTATIDGVFLTVDTNFNTIHRIEVILDADNEISESNEGDNRFSGNDYTLNNAGGC